MKPHIPVPGILVVIFFLFIAVNCVQSEVLEFVVDIMKLLDQLTGCFVYL